jgi:vancomycin permeability regulator SanA
MNYYGKGVSFQPKGQNRRRKLPRWLRWFLLVVLAGILWTLYVLAQIGSVERNTAGWSTNSISYDVGIVLGAALWSDVPSPGLEERLQQALKDYREGKFRYFILTGGLDTAESKYTEAEGMANYLEEHGVPREIMLLENKATSTYENLKFSQQIMEERQLKSALIITHTFHGNRAFEIAESLHYDNPKLSLTETKVLNPIFNTTREVLAYTKWKMEQLGMAIGLKS